jgi:pterin-4a-carbinolamine dehydratase
MDFSMTDIKELVEWLIRIEGKLDDSLKRTTTLEAETREHIRRVAKIEDEIEGDKGFRQGLSAMNQRVGTIEGLAHHPLTCEAYKFVTNFRAGTNGALAAGKAVVGLTRTVWAIIIGVPTAVAVILGVIGLIHNWK